VLLVVEGDAESGVVVGEVPKDPAVIDGLGCGLLERGAKPSSAGDVFDGP
jgi:hypothetical protein